mgnify:CR=1 FL=1|tara:strand:- start:22 stop:924 length:903 start_codon:yes stop_codon:yes gene_type:complete
MTINPNAYFEASIKREDPNNLKSNIIKESFFDTGKGVTTDEYEETTSGGTTLFKDKTKKIGSAMFESSYMHTPKFIEKDKDGGEESYTETDEYSSRSLDIGVPDLIEHKDQLLGEIHKIKGFENVTIEDVIQGKTGLDTDTLFNILAKSDASFATAAKQDKALKEDLEARGIKSGQGFSMSSGDEIGKSLKGTMGYRIGQLNPASKFMGSTNYTTKSESRYNSEGLVKPNSQEIDMMNTIATNINQSVEQSRTTTVIQPVINNVEVPTPVPQPTPVPVKGKTNTVFLNSSNNNILAKLIR